MNTAIEIKESKKVEIYKLLTTERDLLSNAQKKVVDWTLPETRFLALKNAITGYKREIKKLEKQIDKLES